MHLKIDFSSFSSMVKKWRLLPALKLLKRCRVENATNALFSNQENPRNNVIESEISIPEVSSRLSGLIEALNVTHKKVEPDFLYLGRSIQEISSEAAELMQGTIKTVNFVGGSSDQGITAKADKLVRESLDQVKASLDDAVDRHGSFKTYMQEISSHFTENYRLCGELKSTARYLKMVGTNMQIECSRSTLAMEMFSIVAQEIRDLSDQFLIVSKKIRNVSEQAQYDQSCEQKEITEDLHNFFKLGEDAQITAKTALEEVEAIINICSEALEQAEKYSKEISVQVGEIIILIQFHDSMRQRIEHVTEAVNDVEKLCAIVTSPEGTDECITKNLGASYEILNIQNAQLQKIIDDIQAVYTKGAQAFRDINENAGGFLLCLSNLETALFNRGGTCAVSSMGPFETMESETSKLSQITAMGTGLLQNMHKAFDSVIQTATGLSSHTDHVREIASRTHLTAINAKVKTEHLGKKGTALNKLAEEVIEVSKKSEGFVARVEELQQLILTSSGNMEAQLNNDLCASQTHAMEGAVITKAIGTASESFDQFKKESSDLSHRATELKRLASQTERQVAFIPMLVDEITRQKGQLEDLCRDLSPWAGMKGVGFDDEMQKMVQRYTMKEERDIAGRQFKGAPGDSFSSVGQDNGQNMLEENLGEDGNLGDNIELF